jgi:hypothetical protein
MTGFEGIASTFRFDQTNSDVPIRSAAFVEVRRLSRDQSDFPASGRRFPVPGQARSVVNPRVFNPQQMRHRLSIGTVTPAGASGMTISAVARFSAAPKRSTMRSWA